jgi:ribonuclease HII
MIQLLLGAMLMSAPIGYCECGCELEVISGLTQEQRNKLYNEIHFCIKKMNACLDKADAEAAKIKDVDIESATRAAIAGAITGLSTRSGYGVVISTCLNTLGAIAGDSYSHFKASKGHVRDAQYYAERADELQERLWRDE